MYMTSAENRLTTVIVVTMAMPLIIFLVVEASAAAATGLCFSIIFIV